MTLHADALAVLQAWPAPDPEQEALRRRYVAHLLAHPDGLSRDCRPAHITTSMLVLDRARERVLLTLHAKSGRWFQLGGHPEPEDTTLLGAALREAVEESGLAASDLTVQPAPLVLDAHPVPFCGDGGVTHLDVMFAAVARDGVRPTVSEESIDVAWWAVSDLPEDDVAAFARLAQSTSEPGGESIRAAADQPSR